ncbi:hypothetical protein B0H13DRAFT_2660420 [Mycena leptocephala]|nr:hypothetical protein B0H13DRAFT_2660420 [Mycena leptocephala]
MFEEAADISPKEIKAYRNFAFPAALSDPTNDPFFSVENATTWITSLGYQLYLLQDDTVVSTSSYNPEDASTKELRAYRNCMVGDDFLGHPFFSLENTAVWINPAAFQAYMIDNQDSFAHHRHRSTYSTPLISRAPSRAKSSTHRSVSRASSRASFVPSSRASSPVSWAASDTGSRPPSAMSDPFIDIHNDDLQELNTVQLPPSLWSPSVEVSITTMERPVSPPLPISGNFVLPAPVPIRKGKGKGKAKAKADPRITITRELKVDEIVDLSIVPSTFPVPRRPTALRIDLSKVEGHLTNATGKRSTLDAYIRNEDQDSWKGSSGSLKGDVTVFGFGPDPTKGSKSRRCHLYCNGVKTCQYFDKTIFSGCERYEPDEDGMRELWDRELEANQTEAALPLGVLARFYARVVYSKCKIKCDGVPILLKLKDAMKYGKRLCVGCSNWSIQEKLLHRYEFIPQNVYENTFEYVFHNNGRLPPGTAASIDESCILTVHPRIALPNCHYTHIIDGCICVGKIQSRPCPTEMLIYIPVEGEYASRKALVVLRNAHNHPMHPQSKPTTEDRAKLGAAVEAVGLTGLTVQKLLNAPATSTIYKGKQVAETSPAFADKRKVRDFITEKKKDQHPRGMGWDGVLHELREREVKLPKEERYIHTAMDKNSFRLVVTMHPYIARFIHQVLSLSIDYTFKRVEGDMDEWEVAGFLDRFLHRLTFASLYCDRQTHPAFAQLFTELFDTVQQVTCEQFKLAPFYPDANCRVVILDGEVPQAQGFADWLSKYNNPEISGIYTLMPDKLLPCCLKTCNPHFDRHINELPIEIPKSVIARLQSIKHLQSQEEVDSWHEFCAAQIEPAIKNWYLHKLANPWILPSVNKFLSKISAENWDITPTHSNYVETAHAGRNAETAIGVGLLTGILQAKERDNIMAIRLAAIERNGVMPHRWNGSAEREKLAAQRKRWKMEKSAVHRDQLTNYDSLKADRESGVQENKDSLERQRALESQIKSIQEEMRLDSHRTDLKEQVNELRRDVEEEKSLRRAWTIRRGIIDAELAQLRKGELAGVRIQGRRPDERPSNDESVASASELNSHVDNSEDGILLTSAANKDMASVEASNESLDPYSAIPSVLRDDHQGPVPMDANINVSTDLDAYPATLLMDSSATAHGFLTDAELGLDFEMDDIFANIDPYSYDFGATPSTDPNNLPLLRMPSASPPPRPATRMCHSRLGRSEGILPLIQPT